MVIKVFSYTVMWLTTPGNTLNIYNFIFTPNHFFHHHNLFSIIILGHHSTSLVRLRLKEAHGLPSGKVTNRAETAPALFQLKMGTPTQGHAHSRTRPLRDPCAQVLSPHLQSMLRILSLRSKISTKAITTIDSERDVAYFLIGLCLFTSLKNKCPEGWTYTLTHKHKEICCYGFLFKDPCSNGRTLKKFIIQFLFVGADSL